SEPGVHSEVAWIDDEHLLCIFESPALPPDLWVVGLDGSGRQLTQSATAAVLAADMARPEVLTWTSRDDLGVRGLLFEPSELVQGSHPLVVFIHGGPVGVATKNWTPWLQFLVQRGYVV